MGAINSWVDSEEFQHPPREMAQRNINKTNLDAFMQEVGEEAISQSLSPPPTEFMRKALHVMGNTPLEEDSKLRQGLLRFALQTLNDHPSLMIRVFVESKGIDAAANLILKECALTWDGLQSLLPEDIRNSFLCASSTLLRQAFRTFGVVKGWRGTQGTPSEFSWG